MRLGIIMMYPTSLFILVAAAARCQCFTVPPAQSFFGGNHGRHAARTARPYNESPPRLTATTLKNSGDVPMDDGEAEEEEGGGGGNRQAAVLAENILSEDSIGGVEEEEDDEEEEDGSDAVSEDSVVVVEEEDEDEEEDGAAEDIFFASVENGAEAGEEVNGDASAVAEENEEDAENMRIAIQLAQSRGGERGARSPFPKPMVGAVIIAKDGRILGQGRSSYKKDAVRAAIADTGIVATPLREWCISWPSDRQLRKDIRESTLYVTLEPYNDYKGTQVPPITQLIALSGIPRVVIGCQDPIPERATKGASSLHAAGLSVTMGVEQEDCEKLISEYAALTMSKLHRMARKHFKRNGRPLGFMHCSVIDSDDAAAFARNGNSFGKDFGGQSLSFRDFGTYELAPPPESIWAADEDEEEDLDTEVDDFFNMEFEEEEWQESLNKNPMMPWYEQVDACVATFPKLGNGPSDDDSVTGRLNGLKWLATYGEMLPAGVERILVMDATDLPELPLTNDDSNLPAGVDVEAFWEGRGRKPTRVLLRHGDNAAAIAAAEAASMAASSAAKAAEAAKEAIESGDAEEAAEAALECQRAATAAAEFLQNELQSMQDLKQRLMAKGAIVEVIKGGEPVDVMNHLGRRSGYKAVVWRAGCWGERGVRAILDGAFQWVSAHLAVDATGGKFWQLMLAESAVQAACGPKGKVKVFAEQEDISLEYCDSLDADKDCAINVNGKPVRHVRLDCRVALVDVNRPRTLTNVKTEPIGKKITEEAPWFL